MKAGEVLALLVWAILLSALAAMLWIWTDNGLQVALLGVVALATLGIAVVLALRRRQRPELLALPDVSLPTAGVAIALAAMLIGAEAGLWLVWVGAGMLVFGIGGLARELLAERRAVGRSRR